MKSFKAANVLLVYSISEKKNYKSYNFVNRFQYSSQTHLKTIKCES